MERKVNLFMKNKNVLFVFDFDGVIVNSVSFLFKMYLNFLKDFGFIGTEEEFEKLNGPKLSENIFYLKKKYNIDHDEKELIENYKRRLSKMYDEIGLTEDVLYVLEWLHQRRYKITLASSCMENEIKKVFERFDLFKYFDSITTGDDVEFAKPSPDIYNLVQVKYPNHDLFVIEDSENGIQSAISAGLKTIYFSKKEKLIKNNVEYSISSFKELIDIVISLEFTNSIIAKSNNVRLNFRKEHILNFSLKEQRQVEDFWNKNAKKNKLFNSKIVCYKSHEIIDNCLVICCYLAEYKYFYFQLKNPKLNFNIFPIGVSGIVIDKNNHSLIGRRSNVLEYKNYFEFLPSGGISDSKINNDVIDFEEQLIEEFEEETSLSRNIILKITSLFLMFDHENLVYDICSKIKIDDELEKLLIPLTSQEHSEIRKIDLSNIKLVMDFNNYVPASIMIMNNLNFKSIF